MVNRSERSGGGPASSSATNPAMINGKRKFCKHFKAVADREELITCYLCSMPQDGPRAGTLYLSTSWICFYSKMLSKKIKVVINIPKVTSITQEKTAKIIPNAIRITTESESYVFASFVSRNNVYKKLMKLWKNSETASDSGTSDLDAPQQICPESVPLESGTASFLLSDSEDVSSESSAPLAVDSADGSSQSQRRMLPASAPVLPRRLLAAEPSSVSPSATVAEPSSAAAMAATGSSCSAVAASNGVEASAGKEQVLTLSEPIAVPLQQQHSYNGGRSAVKLWHGKVSLNVRGVAVHLASVSRQSIMLIITVALCLTSTMTMYRLSVLESSAAVGSGRPVSPDQWQSRPDAASLLGSARPSDRIIVTILDSNLQMLHEIKDSLDMLKTLLDRRQQPAAVVTEGLAVKGQRQPSMKAVQPSS